MSMNVIESVGRCPRCQAQFFGVHTCGGVSTSMGLDTGDIHRGPMVAELASLRAKMTTLAEELERDAEVFRKCEEEMNAKGYFGTFSGAWGSHKEIAKKLRTLLGQTCQPCAGTGRNATGGWTPPCPSCGGSGWHVDPKSGATGACVECDGEHERQLLWAIVDSGLVPVVPEDP